MKMTKRFPVHDHTLSQEIQRLVRRSESSTSFYHRLHYPLISRSNEKQNRNLSTYHNQATVPGKRCSPDSTSPSNEESSSLNIKITSAFSLNSNISEPSNGKESNVLNFKPGRESQISSQFAPSPILWQPYEPEMTSATPKPDQAAKSSFEIEDDRKGPSQSTDHFGEDVDDSMFPCVKPKHRRQGYTRFGTSQEVAAENPNEISNKRMQNHGYIRHQRGESSRFLSQDRGTEEAFIRPTRKDFETKSKELNREENQQVSVHLPEEPENFIYSNMKYFAQTVEFGYKQSPGSVETCQQDTAGSKSLSFATIKTTKQAQVLDEFIATDMITRGMSSSLSSRAGEHHHHSAVVRSHWPWNTRSGENGARLVDYTANVRLPMQLQNSSTESFHKFQMNSKAQQLGEFYHESLEETDPINATAPLNKMNTAVGQHLKKAINWKTGKPKRKCPRTQILITPAPELFENLENEFRLENDEEPIVKIPNYFFDSTIECTSQKNLLTPKLVNCSSKVNVNSPDSDKTSQPDVYSKGKSQNQLQALAKCQSVDTVTIDDMHKMKTSLEIMKPRENVTKESRKVLCVAETPQKRVTSFFRKSSLNHPLCKDVEEKSISTSQVFAGVSCDSTVHEYPRAPLSSNPAGLEQHEENGYNRAYKRTGGAHPSIKPTPDFCRLLPSSREIVFERPTGQDFETDMVQKPEGTKKPPLSFSEKVNNKITSAGLERGGFAWSNLPENHVWDVQDTRIPNNINNLSQLESPKLTNALTAEKFVFYSSANCCLNGSPIKQITPPYTETSGGQYPTSELCGRRKYKCEVCGQAFSRSNTLTTHKRIHTGDRPFPCDMCGRAFRQLGNLTRHKQTHAAYKPHACPKCNKSFSRMSNLNTHLRTHTNYKPFVCDYCGKGFHQKVDMKIHRYTHTGEKPHKCVKCGRGFKQLTHLKYHMRTHSDVRLYKCQDCGKGFNQKGNLQAHIHGHTGTRPFRCDICGKGFTLTSTLNTHKRIHAPDKPFKCEFCDKAFYQKNALKTHYISSHPYTDGVCLL